MKEILITLALAAALVASACTDDSPLSPDPLPGNQQNACQGSERERPCPADQSGETGP